MSRPLGGPWLFCPRGAESHRLALSGELPETWIFFQLACVVSFGGG